MKIYTKTGDNGTTGLFDGSRISKANIRVDTYGTIDELNTIIGIVLSEEQNIEIKTDLQKICNILFVLASDIAYPINNTSTKTITRIEETNIQWIENLIDNYTLSLPVLNNFILPGGCRAAAHLHHARTVCRRAERLAVELNSDVLINNSALKFLNRLSDYLFVAARYSNLKAGVEDTIWEK